MVEKVAPLELMDLMDLQARKVRAERVVPVTPIVTTEHPALTATPTPTVHLVRQVWVDLGALTGHLVPQVDLDPEALPVRPVCPA